MKTYNVEITTTFIKTLKVNAEDKESAIRLIENDIERGNIDALETNDFDTQIIIK